MNLFEIMLISSSFFLVSNVVCISMRPGYWSLVTWEMVIMGPELDNKRAPWRLAKQSANFQLCRLPQIPPCRSKYAH